MRFDYSALEDVKRSSLLLLFIYLFIFFGSAAQRGLWPPRSRGFLITHNDGPQSVGLLWTSDEELFPVKILETKLLVQ
jgi:hypothetical protein